jgi:AAA15 family ATPase/GTPase
MAQTISFQNFKPFGTKQTFTKKPITLVYGPNSGGKSSFIEALLYFENIKSSEQFELKDTHKLNITNKYFAGDKINIDDFSSIVFQKDKSKKITFYQKFTSKKHFEKYIPFFDGALKISKEIDIDYFLQKDLLTEEDKAELYDLAKKYIKFSEIYKYQKVILNFIKWYLKLIKYISNIKTLEVRFIIASDNQNKPYLEVEIYINDTLLATKNYKTGDIKLSNHPLIETSKEFDDIDNYHFNDTNELYWKSILKLPLELIKKQETSIATIFITDIFDSYFSQGHEVLLQYIGSLRVVPQKQNLYNRFTQKTINYTSSIRKIFRLKKQNIILPLYYSALNIIQKLQQTNKRLDKYSRRSKALLYLLKTSLKKGILHIVRLILCMFCTILKIVLLTYLRIIAWIITFIWLFLLDFVQKIVFDLLKYIIFKSQNSIVGGMTSKKMWSDFVVSKDIQKEIDEWLSNSKMKTSYKVHVENIKPKFYEKIFGIKERYRLGFLDKNTNTIVYPNEMGTGISQVLPILISAKMRENTNIYISQPELHLHPALQSEVADEFIKSINKNKNEFVLETHSEHLLLRLMKRMKQTYEGTLEDENLKLTPDDVALLYVDNNGESSYILELELDEDGTLLDPWPGGFFEEGFKERFF